MQSYHSISPEHLSIERVTEVITSGLSLDFSKESEYLIEANRRFLENKLKNSNQNFYGINTGFGSLCDIRISNDELEQLQENLVKSHAAGVGEEVPQEIIKIMLLLKIQSLALGHSGIRMVTIKMLADFFNLDIIPVVYQLGSLGASGDLAPLAHLSLPLIGLGEVYFKGERMAAPNALKAASLQPIKLQAKEGLALLNGTQFSAAYGVWCLSEMKRWFEIANLCAALSMEAFNCHTSPFDERLQKIRPHEGQLKVAERIRDLRANSPIAEKEKIHVQDPYAFRCVPQVHGATWGVLSHVEQVFLTEINSATDNPVIFHETDAILSGGNFHAQPLALALDYFGIGVSELGNISERRTFQLISGLRGLPAFLIRQPGLHSGLMIAQYTAASVVSQNKQLCTPASVDSIVSSNGQEDHVSMAANAATKSYRIVQNLKQVLAIEWMTAAQALEFRRPELSSPKLESILSAYRKIVPALESDRVISTDIEKTVNFLQTLTPPE